ncbi:MAG: hypothetical protein AB1546_01645 [bacterium]
MRRLFSFHISRLPSPMLFQLIFYPDNLTDTIQVLIIMNRLVGSLYSSQ